MSTVARTRVVLSGSAVVGGGVSTWYWNDAVTGVNAAIAAFYNAIKSSFPDKVTFTIPNNGDILTVETGQIEGVWTEGSTTVVTGTDTGNFVMGTGARLRLNTGGITAGRRVRGTIFLVPLGVAVFNEDAGLQSTFVAGVLAAANAMLSTAGDDLLVYSPPTPPPGGIGPDRPGKVSAVTSVSVPSEVSWLRSRRT